MSKEVKRYMMWQDGSCSGPQDEGDWVTSEDYDALLAERDGLAAARTAYASEFAPDKNGDPDVGSVHANIRALKTERDQLRREVESLRGLKPDFPPRPPAGDGLPRYGLRWNGPQQPLAVPMADGYWTPWHLADALRKDAERYRWLKNVASAASLGWLHFKAAKDDWDATIDAAMAAKEA